MKMGIGWGQDWKGSRSRSKGRLGIIHVESSSPITRWSKVRIPSFRSIIIIVSWTFSYGFCLNVYWYVDEKSNLWITCTCARLSHNYRFQQPDNLGSPSMTSVAWWNLQEWLFFPTFMLTIIHVCSLIKLVTDCFLKCDSLSLQLLLLHFNIIQLSLHFLHWNRFYLSALWHRPWWCWPFLSLPLTKGTLVWPQDLLLFTWWYGTFSTKLTTTGPVLSCHKGQLQKYSPYDCPSATDKSTKTDLYLNVLNIL